MERYLLKKYFPKLIIVEGLWRSGKTTFANYLASKYSFIFIREPKHRNLVDEKEISDWYFNQHINRQIKARSINSKKKVIMERSIISNVAYQYAKIGHLYPRYKEILLKFPELHFSTILFLNNGQPLLNLGLKQSTNNYIDNQYLSEKFIKRYVEFYQNILPKIINNHPIFVRTKKNEKFLTKKQIFTNFKKGYRSLLRNKKSKVVKSGSAIIFYKNHVLLMYDKDWRHNIFPQGQAKKGENMLLATTREIKEETGYFDLELLLSLPEYQYYYQDSKNLVSKQIKAYIFNLRSLKRVGKSLEPHENYQNRFVPVKKAINFLKWPEDKVVLREAIKKTRLLRNKRVH